MSTMSIKVTEKLSESGRFFVMLLSRQGRTCKGAQWAKTEAERDALVRSFQGIIDADDQRKADRRAAKKAHREATLAKGNPYKIGDLLSNSWGYDQTNVDFYQVVAVTERSVTIREIAGDRVEGTEGFMSCQVRPVRDSFCGEPKRINLQVYPGGQEPYIPTRHGCMSRVQDGESTYCSWYA